MKRTKFLLIFLVLICSGLLASAATLSYLSNQAQAKIKVDEPPVILEYYDAVSSTWKKFETGTLDLGSIYGSDSSSWKYKVTKLAHSEPGNNEVQIEGTLWGKLYCADGIGLADLDKVSVYAECPALGYTETFDWTNDGDASNDDFTPVDMGNWLKFEHETKILYSQWGYKGTITLVFDQYAYGEYELTMQIK